MCVRDGEAEGGEPEPEIRVACRVSSPPFSCSPSKTKSWAGGSERKLLCLSLSLCSTATQPLNCLMLLSFSCNKRPGGGGKLFRNVLRIESHIL